MIETDENHEIISMEEGNCKEELALYGENSGVQAEGDEQTLTDPFDPKEIRISNKTISLDQIIRRLKNGTIRLSPDFQRNAVWNNTKKSQLIESLMLNIPIPMFYVAADNEGSWDVVDGLQRLTAIKEFLVDKTLKLKNLEFWTSYTNKKIDDPEFSPILYNRIYETEFSVVVIEPGTPDSVKYNIFKRINTGGMALSAQEIRHALYQGEGTKLLQKLASDEFFLNATDHSINDTRMVAREIILRCIAFMLVGASGYKKNDNMESFLRKSLQILNYLDDKPQLVKKKIFNLDTIPHIQSISYTELTKLFRISMERNFIFFGKNAFRISHQSGKRSPINKALFETWGTLFAFISKDDFKKLLANKEKVIAKFDKLKDDEKFNQAVSRNAWLKTNVDYRFKEISSLIEEIIN